MIVVMISELSWLRIKLQFFFIFGYNLHLANRHYTFGVVFFIKLVCQKLFYASKRTIGHDYRYSI